MTGIGSVRKWGPGTTTLSGTNSYSGITAADSGTLAISADANLGTPPGAFNLYQFQFFGGTLRATQSFTMAATRGISFSFLGGTIEVDATKTLTYPNSLSLSTGMMTKDGAGALALEGLEIGGTATVNLSGGTLRFDNYSRAASGTFNFNSGTIQLAGNRDVGSDAAIADLFGAAPAISTGKGLTVEGTATLAKPLTIDGGTFKANSLVIGAGGALDFDRGILELTGGTITGLANLAVPTNGEFRASGVQALRITGAAGSTISATGNLTLGNAAAVNGFGTQGTLQVGANSVTLLDANDVVFDSLALATLGSAGSPGTLNAANGLTLDFGGNVTGFGAVSTPNNVAKPMINNGHITGNSVAQRITLPGYVKGVGTFNHVNFTGTFDPGLSAAFTTVGSIALAPTSTLIMELGGTSRGGQYDAILASGNLGLGGALNVTLIDGFNPAAGHTYDLFDWSTRSGTFASINLPALAGLAWNTSQLYTTGALSLAAAGLIGDYNQNGAVDAADYTMWRNTRGSTTNLVADGNGNNQIDVGDYTVWRQNFGYTSGNGSATNAKAAVPEPATTVMLLIVAVAGCCLRRGRDDHRGHSRARRLRWQRRRRSRRLHAVARQTRLGGHTFR
ncbi:MAG: autotransporter-associated beta strand repeat-containing protein [Pirellulales bacterium]